MMNYEIIYENIVSDRRLHACTRLLAADLQQTPYKTVGDFMKEMSDDDVQSLCRLVDNEESPDFSEIVLIVEMLARAEGLPTPDVDTLTKRINMMIGFIVIESLDRKGLAHAVRANMSFGDEVKNKIIVKKIIPN